MIVPADTRVVSASWVASGSLTPPSASARGRVSASETDRAAPASAVPRAEPIWRTVDWVAEP